MDEVPRSMFYIASMLVDIAKGETRIEPYNITSIWICAFNPLEDASVPSLLYYMFENTYKKKDDIYGSSESFELNDGLTLIFINARFKWEKILEKRDLTKKEKALMEYIADMKQSDTSRIMHKEAATVLSLYKEGGRMHNKIHEEYMEFQKEEADKLIEEGKNLVSKKRKSILQRKCLEII